VAIIGVIAAIAIVNMFSAIQRAKSRLGPTNGGRSSRLLRQKIRRGGVVSAEFLLEGARFGLVRSRHAS
jgi:hypothetical protein